jgi:glycosyltransferase involved in cell wall biosynthesis
MRSARVVIVMSGFPRRSETFALTEVDALVERGLVAAIFGTKAGETGPVQPIAARLRSRVRLLDGDDPSTQAREAARTLESTTVTGVHGYFAHQPAAVASDLAALLHVPFGFSAHARDARKMPRHVLHTRARQAACVVACNGDVASEFDGSGARVDLVPHGVDTQRFVPAPQPPGSVFRMLAVGRLVEKKGFDVLIDAAMMLPGAWRLRIVGDGPERWRLGARARALRIDERITFCGPLTHDVLPAEYADADAVVVPSVRDASGDRDGLPNVVLEAMASGRAIVASDVGAIASAVRDERTGLLVPAGDRLALAHRLHRIARDPELRRSLGARAREMATGCFDARYCTARLASVLEQAYA